MKQIKTLTVNGNTYEIADPDAAHIDDSAVGTDAWSSRKISDAIGAAQRAIIHRLCPAFSQSGEVVTCQPVEGYPLDAVTQIQPVQSGSGDPSPANIRPITGHTSCKLYRHGKNFLKYPYYMDSRTINGVTFTVNSDGSVTANGTCTADNTSFYLARYSGNADDGLYLPVGKYTLSGCPAGGSHSTYRLACSGNAYGLDAYDIGSGTTGTTKEARARTSVSIQIMKAGVTLNNVVFKPQIELGAEATAYEPCQGSTFTLDLGQTVYGGSLDWSTGVLTVDRLLHTLDGTEDWKTKTDSGCADGLYYYQCEFAVDYDPKNTSAGISSHYLYNTSKTAPGFWVERRAWKKLGVRIVCAYETPDELAAFLAEQYAAGTPVQVCYQLATPITVQLTPTEILALSGQNTLYSDTGDTTVTGRADLPALLQSLTAAQ